MTTFKKVFWVIAATRIVIFIAALTASMFLAQGPAYNSIHENSFLNAWAQYDAAAYLDIAENGYNKNFMSNGNYQWWPLLPMIIRFGNLLFDSVFFGFIIANTALIGGMYYLYQLVKDEIGRDSAYITCSWILVYPTSYFLSAIYTESLFLLLSVMAIYYARKGKWNIAGIAAGLCVLTRSFGVMIAIPLFLIYLKERGFWDRFKGLDKDVLWLGLIPAALLIFMLFLHIQTGDPLKFTDHSQTRRSMGLPFQGVVDEIKAISFDRIFDAGYHIFNLGIYIMFLAATIIAFKTLSREYAWYLAGLMLLPTITTPLEAISRYTIVMFPAFIIFSKCDKRLLKLGITASLTLLIFFTTWHVRGGIVLP